MTSQTQTQASLNCLVYIEAYSISNHFEGPSFITLHVDEKFLSEITRLQIACAENGLNRVSVDKFLDWGPEGIDEKLRIINNELVVSANDFWFAADIKHAEYSVETRLQDIGSFIDKVRNQPVGIPLVMGDGYFVEEFEIPENSTAEEHEQAPSN